MDSRGRAAVHEEREQPEDDRRRAALRPSPRDDEDHDRQRPGHEVDNEEPVEREALVRERVEEQRAPRRDDVVQEVHRDARRGDQREPPEPRPPAVGPPQARRQYHRQEREPH